MPSIFSIRGHAAVRVLTYTENGVHNEFTAPGGAKVISANAGVSIMFT